MAVITSLSMVAGTQAHITVGDANSANAPIADANITVAVFDSGGTGLAVTVDPAGGYFLDATSPGAVNIIATYHDGAIHVAAPILPITVTAAVMPVYLSP